MRHLRAIWRGVGYVEGYGNHPGTVVLAAFAIMGWVAARSWVGAALMLAIFGPFYLYGAYDRGRHPAPHDSEPNPADTPDTEDGAHE